MAHSGPTCQSFMAFSRSFKKLQVSDPLTKCLAPRLFRPYATHTDLPTPDIVGQRAIDSSSKPPTAQQVIPRKRSSRVFTTIYSWPSMEPSSISSYPAHQLELPLRRDILHRAVVYEGDNKRQGTASTKHRTQVRGSSRKVRPQKGTGRARLSDRKSPSIRGGGVAHGPHPTRVFATELPNKIYDLAWRTALSHRYRKGELIILDNPVDLPEDCTARWLHNFFMTNAWGKGNGRTLIVRQSWEGEARKAAEARLLESMGQVEEHAKVKSTIDVDVKDLLSCGRVVIERNALREILNQRSKLVTV